MTVSIEILHEETIDVIKAAIVDLIESKGNLKFEHPLSRAIGKYGANVRVLKKNGFIKPYAQFNGELKNPRVWTGKLGMRSRMDFYTNEEIQENLNTVELRDLYEELSLNGGIQPNDPESDVAGLITVAKAFGSKATLQFRTGEEIHPRPLLGVYQTVNDTDMRSQMIPWFQKGFSTVAQAGTLGKFNKSPDFFTHYLLESQKNTVESNTISVKKHTVDYSLSPADRQSNAQIYLTGRREDRAVALNKFKSESSLTGSDVVREFYRQVRSGKIKF